MSSGSSVPPGALLEGENPSRSGPGVGAAALGALLPSVGDGAGAPLVSPPGPGAGVGAEAVGFGVPPPGAGAFSVRDDGSERCRASGPLFCGPPGFASADVGVRGAVPVEGVSPSTPFRRARPVPVIRSKSEGLPDGVASLPSTRRGEGAGRSIAGRSGRWRPVAGRSSGRLGFFSGVLASGGVNRAAGRSAFASAVATVARAATAPEALAATALCSCFARASGGAGF